MSNHTCYLLPRYEKSFITLWPAGRDLLQCLHQCGFPGGSSYSRKMRERSPNLSSGGDGVPKCKGMVSHWDTLALCLVLGVMQRGAAFPRGLELMEQAVFHLQDVWYQHFLLHRARISSEDKGRKWCFFFPAGCCSAVPSALGPRCSGL